MGRGCLGQLNPSAARGAWYTEIVQLRPPLFALLIPLMAVSAVACGHGKPSAKTAVPAAPRAVETLDQFETTFNRYVLLPDGAAQRASYRAALEGYLSGYLDRALERSDDGEAISALQYAAGLYSPAELRTAPPSERLAEQAHAVYRQVARRGAEDPSFLALAIEQRFGNEAQRKKAVENWELVEQWLVRNGPYASEPVLRHEDLERSLEQVAAVFPSPFVVKRLADLYVARYDTAKNLRSKGRAVGSVAVRRTQITGYLLMRLYLRADDFDGALAAMDRVELDMPVAKLRELMVDAMKPRRSPLPMLTLAEQFVPEEDADPSAPYAIQGWGIVDNISRRVVANHPKDAYGHMLRARSLSQAGMTGAAIVHLRRAIELKEDIFEAWQALASLQQQELERTAAADAAAALEMLSAIETMHAQARGLWADRPISPGLPEAFFTVAESLYQAGEVDEAQKLLERSLSIEPVPSSLDLLGTIALKRSKLAVARDRYESLAQLAYESETAQLQWEARARQQLGEIALREGDATGSSKHIRIALRHTNDLLSRTVDSSLAQADQYVERGKLLFLLGDVRLAMADFRRAGELQPTSVKAYADPMRYAMEHGYYTEARQIYRRAMDQPSLSSSLKLYFSLWVRELALAQGVAVDNEATTFLTDFKGKGWEARLAEHARGELDFAALLAAANNRGEKAEAYFYEGLAQFRSGDATEAKTMMKHVLDSEMMGFFEYDLARAYLQAGTIPKSPRPPLTTQAQR